MDNTLVSGREWDDESEEEKDAGWGPLDKIRGAVLWGTDWTAETLISQLKKENILLTPKFQRRDAWSPKKKSKFIESIILRLPIPEIILAESKEEDGKFIVLDGKQRLLSLRQFAAKTGDTFDQLILSDLEILSNLNGHTYDKLSQLTFNADYRNLFDNSAIRTVIVRNWPNSEYLHTVFLRLNTGSLPLSPQELRQALKPGGFIDFAEEFSSDDKSSKWLRKSLGIQKPDPRMRDVELIIRYFAYKNFLVNYQGRLSKFLDDTCERLNKEWKRDSQRIKRDAVELNSSISCTFKIFGEKHAFSKWADGKFFSSFNRPVFDIMTYYFSDPAIRKAALAVGTKVKTAFEQLCINDLVFRQSLELGTSNVDATTKRFEAWGITLSKILKLNIPIVIPKPQPKVKRGRKS